MSASMQLAHPFLPVCSGSAIKAFDPTAFANTLGNPLLAEHSFRSDMVKSGLVRELRDSFLDSRTPFRIKDVVGTVRTCEQIQPADSGFFGRIVKSWPPLSVCRVLATSGICWKGPLFSLN